MSLLNQMLLIFLGEDTTAYNKPGWNIFPVIESEKKNEIRQIRSSK